jgi:hypothetical protein
MNPGEILEKVRCSSKQPIRIHMSDGSAYEVRHPEMALVTRTALIVVTSLGRGGIPDHTVTCDPLHVTRIEPIVGAEAPESSAEGNGH